VFYPIPFPGNDDSAKSIRIIVDVILDAIQNGSSKRVEAPTKRKDITPITQEPDFVDQEDEPEVTLPEGYDENDFDDRKEQTKESAEPEPKVTEVAKDSTAEAEGKPAETEEPASDSDKK
jgi:small subunit ribosomal protein S2